MAVADKSAPEFRGERDPVDAFQTGDFAGDFAFLGVDHVHFVGVRDIHSAAVGDQVIPAAFAANGDFLDLMVAALGKRRCQNE